MSVTPTRTVKLSRRIPTGYQVVSIAKDGNCLFNAIMDGMIHQQLQIPSAWVTQDTWTRGQSMRTSLVQLCNSGYRVLPKYKHLRETLSVKGDGKKSLFQEIFTRLSTNTKGQDSERALIATRYNITARVYDAYAHRWIFNSAADPSGERVIAIRWARISTHYDLLIPEGDDFALNRSSQLQHILSRCSLQSQNPRPITQVPNGKPQCRMQFKSQSSQEEEEVDYGFSSLEELYPQEGSQDFDWDQDRFVHD